MRFSATNPKREGVVAKFSVRMTKSESETLDAVLTDPFFANGGSDETSGYGEAFIEKFGHRPSDAEEEAILSRLAMEKSGRGWLVAIDPTDALGEFLFDNLLEQTLWFGELHAPDEATRRGVVALHDRIVLAAASVEPCSRCGAYRVTLDGKHTAEKDPKRGMAGYQMKDACPACGRTRPQTLTIRGGR